MIRNIHSEVWLWYGLAILVIAADQVSKWWITASLSYGDPWVFTSFFNFTLLHNYGAAFSFLSDAGGWQKWFFSTIAVAISVGIVVWMSRLNPSRRLELIALSLVLGGAVGNLYDRLTLGYVVDFIVVHYQDNYWPAFNIADSAICVGAVLLVVDSLTADRHSKSEAKAAEK